jgi:nucleotide-binding universal stress UspA family protein
VITASAQIVGTSGGRIRRYAVVATQQTIVVGVDGSVESAEALQWAADQAERTGARLHGVIAWQLPVFYGGAPPVIPFQQWSQDARRALEETAEKVLGPRWQDRLEVTVAEGHPAQVLLHAAEEAELLVVGSRGHGGFAGLLLGSVSNHVTAHAHCPVVVVHAAPSGQETANP